MCEPGIHKHDMTCIINKMGGGGEKDFEMCQIRAGRERENNRPQDQETKQQQKSSLDLTEKKDERQTSP